MRPANLCRGPRAFGNEHIPTQVCFPAPVELAPDLRDATKALSPSIRRVDLAHAQAGTMAAEPLHHAESTDRLETLPELRWPIFEGDAIPGSPAVDHD